MTTGQQPDAPSPFPARVLHARIAAAGIAQAMAAQLAFRAARWGRRERWPGCLEGIGRKLSQERADSVEKVGFCGGRVSCGGTGWSGSPSDGRRLERHGDQPGEFPKILGGGGKNELVFCAIRTTETQPVELQDALEVSEEHFDLLPFSP